MDDFTHNHLVAYAKSACYDADEVWQFVRFVERMDVDDLAYVCEHGWPVALASWRCDA